MTREAPMNFLRQPHPTEQQKRLLRDVLQHMNWDDLLFAARDLLLDEAREDDEDDNPASAARARRLAQRIDGVATWLDEYDSEART